MCADGENVAPTECGLDRPVDEACKGAEQWYGHDDGRNNDTANPLVDSLSDERRDATQSKTDDQARYAFLRPTRSPIQPSITEPIARPINPACTNGRTPALDIPQSSTSAEVM